MYGLSKYEDSFYTDNVSAFLAFAPCSKITNTTNAGIRSAAENYDIMDNAFGLLGIDSIYGPTWEADRLALCLLDA